MKNSVWYHKLWRKKLDQLPASGDADQAWADMSKILDEHLPVDDERSNKVVKPLVAKLITLLGYALPAAAMIGAASYFVAPVFHKPKPQPQKEQHSHGHGKLEGAQLSATMPVPFEKRDTITNDSVTLSSQIQISDSERNVTVAAAGNLTASGSDVKPTETGPVSVDRFTPFINSSPSKRKSNSSKLIAKAEHGKRTDEPNIEIAEKDTDPLLNDQTAQKGTLSANSDTKEPNTGKVEQEKQPVIAVTPQKGSKLTKQIKKTKEKAGTRTLSKFNFGLEAGINAGRGKASPYGGLFGEYAFRQKWLIGTGLRVMSRSVSGIFTHSSYYRPDSSAFSINDERRLLNLTIPIQLTYRINDRLSIGAGPLININSKQLKVSNSFGTITDRRDTLSHTGQIDTALRSTTFNKINVGAAVGVSYHLDRLSIDARYQLLAPDKVSNSIGNYSRSSHFFQIGVSYRFKQSK